MIQHHVHISSIDQFNQVGVYEKNDRNEINSVDDHRVWLYIALPFPHRPERFMDCLLTDLCSSFVSSFSLVVGCGSTFARDFPNMPQ